MPAEDALTSVWPPPRPREAGLSYVPGECNGLAGWKYYYDADCKLWSFFRSKARRFGELRPKMWTILRSDPRLLPLYCTASVTPGWLLAFPIFSTMGTALPVLIPVGTRTLTCITAAIPGAAPA